jgi:hypothetical protein
MSTSPESIHVADRIAIAVSRWLVEHLSDEELRAELEAVDLTQLTPEQVEAVLELQNELDVTAERPALEVVAREALQAVALCG